MEISERQAIELGTLESTSGSGSGSSKTDVHVHVHIAAETRIIEPDQQQQNHVGSTEDHANRQEFSLPPVDGGKNAWMFLAACFVLEMCVWGFPFAFGVFQDYYTFHAPFAGSRDIATIGTCAMGIMYLDTPLIMGLLKLYPRQGRWSPIPGLLIMCLGLALSSFSTTVTHLIITQGILYGVGGSVAYSPCIVYIDEWFVRRKGLAYGIMWSGTGLAGVIFPLVLEYLLSTYGFRTTLRLWSALVLVVTVPLAYYIKPRIPIPTSTSGAASHNSVRARPFDLGFVLSRPFVLYQLANAVEATGFFLPGIYLPQYARSTFGAGPFPSVLTILLVNVAAVVGCICMGVLIDRLHVTTCILVSTVGATSGIFLLWGFSTTLPMLYTFCIVYGLFAGSFTSTWPGIMRHIATPPSQLQTGNNNEVDRAAEEGSSTYGSSVDPSMVFAFLALGRGVGNVASGPLSEALVRAGSSWQGRAGAGYGSGFGVLIAFTGVTALLGGGSFMWRKLGWL
ncbi:MFS monocarboxylate transporter [Diplogelasinospora grovesii]|uniref:MFS monocarboxylate transporter n=1 Tax=Diplogelasinospora grovesii TaxID=303347 RepID=A0AAN6NG87_9PEZI|nr:MFS monocarboxylate transporter [Diplogelasinospora grovesii]